MAAQVQPPTSRRPLQDEDLLISVSGGLGRFDEDANVYRKDADCLECLKDLQRFLRRDDPYTRDVFHRLCQWDLVATDLVPLVVQYQDDSDVVYNALKVLTFLTMPVDPESDDLHVQCRELARIKDCFLANDAVAVIVGLLSRPLSRYPRLSEKDILVVQLVLTFVRNLLCVDSAARDLGIDNPLAEEDERKGNLISRLFKDNVLELVLLVAQHCNEKAFKNDASLVLHIVYQVFEGFSPLQLFQKRQPKASGKQPPSSSSSAAAASKRSGGGGNQSRQDQKLRGDLANALLSERRARVTSRSKLPMRHRLFSGTFVKKYKDVTQKVVFTQRSAKPDVDRDEQTYRSAGKRGKAARERALYPMDDDLRDLLRTFTESFLSGGYDVLMDSIRPELMHGIGISRLEKEDYIRFFRLSWFCTTYKKLRMERISAQELHDKYESAGLSPFSEISSTMGWDMFHLLLTVWQHQIEIPSRAEEKDWDLQASSLALLKEMMYVLDLAYRIGTKADRKAADKLQRKLLHDDLRQSGLFPLLCRMIKNYNMKNQPASQAGDMMEALYIIIHTFERLDKTERGGFIVRQRASRRRAKLTRAGLEEGEEEGTEPRAQEKGQEKDAEATAEDAEKEGDKGAEATAKPGENAAAKEGAQPDSKEGEVGKDGEAPQEQQNKSQSMAPLEMLENESGTDSDDRMALKESTFDLNHRLSQELTAPLLINTLTFVLESYRTNSAQLNASVVGVLKRIVLPDCLNLMPCVWHLSFLLVAEKILSDSGIAKDKSFSSMVQICKYITRKLMDRLQPELTDDMDAFQKSAKQALARITFVDLLFWKNRRDAEIVRDEYGWQNKYAHREAIRKALADEDEACGAGILKSIDKLAPGAAPAMTEADEEALREAHERHKDADDMVDRLVEDLNFRFKPRQLRKELKRLGLAVKSKSKSQKSKLDEEELVKLAELWETHKGEKDRMKAIAEGLGFKYTTRRLSSELRILGLLEAGAPAGGSRKITQDQVERVKAAFKDHESSATVVEDIEAALEGQVTKAQIRRVLKKHGLERRKFTKLADTSDESESEGDGDGARGKAKASPWEVGGSDEEEASDSSESEEEEDSSEEEMEEENGKAGAPTPAKQAEKRKKGVGEDSDPAEDRGGRPAKRGRILKKRLSLSQPEPALASLLDDEMEDEMEDELENVEDVRVTPVEKRAGQIAMLDSDSDE